MKHATVCLVISPLLEPIEFEMDKAPRNSNIEFVASHR